MLSSGTDTLYDGFIFFVGEEVLLWMKTREVMSQSKAEGSHTDDECFLHGGILFAYTFIDESEGLELRSTPDITTIDHDRSMEE